MDEPTYKIVRYCADSDDPAHQSVVETGLTLEEAQAHCQDDNTHYHDPETGEVVWFDGYQEES